MFDARAMLAVAAHATPNVRRHGAKCCPRRHHHVTCRRACTPGGGAAAGGPQDVCANHLRVADSQCDVGARVTWLCEWVWEFGSLGLGEDGWIWRVEDGRGALPALPWGVSPHLGCESAPICAIRGSAPDRYLATCGRTTLRELHPLVLPCTARERDQWLGAIPRHTLRYKPMMCAPPPFFVLVYPCQVAACADAIR